MLKNLSSGIIVALMAASQLGAQRTPAVTDVPPIVLRGLEAYVARGSEAAIEAWLAGSPATADPSTKASAVDGLRNVERQYGRVVGHDILGIARVGATVRRVYLVIRYERGPLYAWFDCYRTASTWIIPGFLVNTRPQIILPPEMLSPPPRSQN